MNHAETVAHDVRAASRLVQILRDPVLSLTVLFATETWALQDYEPRSQHSCSLIQILADMIYSSRSFVAKSWALQAPVRLSNDSTFEA
ncbi:hypothetical protein SAMN04487967_0412 [Natronorubrum sediminis]|uniref:Uncharacterized protein n=1 Tax=Natronorubrum sediminis TaxID=640943 RepID=A0A1H6FL38_9EURY|nr:hypothetical protein SAMN04487967_0412 [Natronorubrum sediminis]